jgi:hypothetical protein
VDAFARGFSSDGSACVAVCAIVPHKGAASARQRWCTRRISDWNSTSLVDVSR